jgi:two-component system, OmpR family, response regulator RegX3
MRIAIVEDDRPVATEMMEALTADGDTCHAFVDAKSFLHALPRESFDACIVDLSQPPMGGPALVRILRERKQTVPALILTSRDSEMDVINALGSGNDDFLVKPVRPGELRARLRAMVRRAMPGRADGDSFEYDRFEFNLKTLQVKDRGAEVDLTQKEFQLAMLLLSNVGKPLSRGHIREAVWGRNSEVPSRTLDTHVSRVRTKLSLRPESGYLLAPVYSYGYRLEHLKLSETMDVAGKAAAATPLARVPAAR